MDTIDFLKESKDLHFNSSQTLSDEILNDYLDLRELSNDKRLFKLSKNRDRFKNLKILDLSASNLTSKEFNEITKYYRPESFNELEILDLSYNSLDNTIALSLVEWARYLVNGYIILTDTPLKLRNIKLLASEIRDNTILLQMIEKLIFIPKNYLFVAKNKVSIYESFVKYRWMPKKWAEIHEKFYKEYTDKLIDRKKVQHTVSDGRDRVFVRSILSFEEFEELCREQVRDYDD